MKKEKGITLIALIITIIILVILAAVSIRAVTNMDIIGRAVKGAEDYAKAAVEENKAFSDIESVIEQGLIGVNPFNKEKGVNTPKTVTGMIPIKWNGSNWVVCSVTDPEWYDYASAEEITADSTRSMSWANVMLSDGTYKSGTVNVGQVVQDSDLGSMFVWIPRYAYSMTKYKAAVDGATDANNGKTQNITRVVFLDGTSNKDKNGKSYARDYDADSQTVGAESEMIVHPAFTFGGTQLTGIWVAKFEASMAGINANTIAENNDKASEKTLKVLPNAESWRYITVGNCFKVSYNMRNNSIYGLPSSTNTHLMKNSEWGAVAYLAASGYGKIPTINTSGRDGSYDDNGTTKYHAYTAGENTSGGYKTNTSQSTTGTVNGVYDMNGGAWEYVAAYWDSGYSGLSTYGSTEYFPSNKLNSTYTAYWDKYEVYVNPENSNDIDGSVGWSNRTTDGNAKLAKAAYERVKLMKTHKGDAMYEVINTFSYYGYNKTNSGNGWLKATYDTDGTVKATNDTKTAGADIYGTGYYDGDYALIGTYVTLFVKRGGGWNDGAGAGVFGAGGSVGGTDNNHGFRPAITN